MLLIANVAHTGLM